MTDKCGITEYCEMRTGDICTLGSPCPHQKPLTNKEHMRTCSDEELAEIFMRFLFDANFKKRFIFGNFEEEFIRWLKENHHD